MLPRPSAFANPRRLAACLVAVLICALPCAAADFDGNGSADLLFRERGRDDHQLRLMLNPGSPDAASRNIFISGETNRARGFDVRVADFDGDGRSDILARDLANGRTRIFLMDGLRVLANRRVMELPEDLLWELQTTADFNGDGSDDLLYRHATTGVWAIYDFAGFALDPQASGPTVALTALQMNWISSADFNGDGRADLLMRHRVTGRWVVHLMNGVTVERTATLRDLPTTPDPQLQGVGDFNGDGRADLLMRERESGRWSIWFLNGTRVLPESGAASLPPNLRFQTQHVGDLNGDGTADVLLRSHDTGRWLVNYMQGRARLAGSGIPALGRDLRIARVLDHDGDAVPDVLASDGDSWRIIDFRNLNAPLETVLQDIVPRDFPLACEQPNYYQFGKPPRPPGADLRSAFLSWSTPVTRENGEALCPYELAGYRIFYSGRLPKMAFDAHIPNGRADAWLIEDLLPNVYSFRILSYDYQGFFSQSSATMVKIIQ